MAHPDALDLLVAPLPPDPELDTYCMMVPFSVEWVNWILRFQSWEVVRCCIRALLEMRRAEPCRLIQVL